MAIPHAKAGEVISVRPMGAELNAASTHTIVKTNSLEVIRIVLATGKRLPPHRVPGEITVQCLEGKVDFFVGELKRELTAGSFLYVEGSGEHAVHAIEDSSLLVTIMLKHKAGIAQFHGDQPISPPEGVCLLPALEGRPLGRQENLYWEHEGNRAVRAGKWKLVTAGRNGPWELYDMDIDRTEGHDVASQHPQIVSEMSEDWQRWAERAQVLPWPANPVDE